MPRDYLKDEERLAWLRLWRSEQIGPATFRRLLQSFGGAKAALERLPDLSRRGRGRPLTAYPAEATAAEVEGLARLGGRFIASCEPDYPIALTAIADAPPVIAALGNASLLRQRAIAIVGARNASANGRFLAEAIARQLGELG